MGEVLANSDFLRRGRLQDVCNQCAEAGASMRRQYGLVVKDYREMFDEQAGVCAFCGDDLDDPHIDHCHDSSETLGYPLVRWLLCRGCNLLLGNCRDNPENASPCRENPGTILRHPVGWHVNRLLTHSQTRRDGSRAKIKKRMVGSLICNGGQGESAPSTYPLTLVPLTPINSPPATGQVVGNWYKAK
jgi:hypothetical protein